MWHYPFQKEVRNITLESNGKKLLSSDCNKLLKNMLLWNMLYSFFFNLNPVWELHNWAPVHFEFDV